MNMTQMQKIFGVEYPTIVVTDGVRMTLRCERRFSRSYESADRTQGSDISRFMDGTAAITAAELQQEWPTWTEAQRCDFCQASCWLKGQTDFPEMLRFIMQHGDAQDWAGIALSVAGELPREEAFDLLRRALSSTAIGKGMNLSQAIGHTKHPKAGPTLRSHLAAVWAHPKLWDDDEFNNWVAYDAITCISHLIEFGVPPAEFEDHVRQLSQHTCAGNRRSCRDHLSKYYSWLE